MAAVMWTDGWPRRPANVPVSLPQPAVAKKHDLPLILHTRKAEARTLEILLESGVTKADFHCFCGKAKLGKKVGRWMDERIDGWMDGWTESARVSSSSALLSPPTA